MQVVHSGYLFFFSRHSPNVERILKTRLCGTEFPLGLFWAVSSPLSHGKWSKQNSSSCLSHHLVPFAGPLGLAAQPMEALSDFLHNSSTCCSYTRSCSSNTDQDTSCLLSVGHASEWTKALVLLPSKV